jgi:hypothetical protein
MPPVATASEAPGRLRAGVGLLREATVVDVAAFIASGATEEEGGHEERPEIVFSQIDPIGLALHYADFNVRSRHFRVIETFFVEVDDDGRIQAVVGTTGLKRDRRVLNVQLVVARPRPGEDAAERLRALLAGVGRVAREFAPGVRKLRFTFVLDPSFGGALGSQVSQVLVDGYERVGLVEEARMANETGPGREAVLLAFPVGGLDGERASAENGSP